jgi:hypothetical protein
VGNSNGRKKEKEQMKQKNIRRHLYERRRDLC